MLWHLSCFAVSDLLMLGHFCICFALSDVFLLLWVIAHLLKPRGWKLPVCRQFFWDCNDIADLCDSAERISASEPSVLQLRVPIKIFGDLHGRFGDLMRLFDEYGAPRLRPET
ncbi:hypothetical protein RND81_01G059800 [Saponaria officinalis]|uniref:Uncharacterized protein n=1 Tax=Saponaria officinalis TaxID=3572 RepID=A0AAW1N663_SAPOF